MRSPNFPAHQTSQAINRKRCGTQVPFIGMKAPHVSATVLAIYNVSLWRKRLLSCKAKQW